MATFFWGTLTLGVLIPWLALFKLSDDTFEKALARADHYLLIAVICLVGLLHLKQKGPNP